MKLNLKRIFSIHIQIIQAIAGDGKSTTDYSDMQKKLFSLCDIPRFLFLQMIEESGKGEDLKSLKVV